MPLGYALTARLADDLGIRALAIKGPVLEAQGLREPRRSVDVDVWVDPARRPDYVTGLQCIGWNLRVESTTAQIVPLHSQTYVHSLWPMEIDLHDRFPGFLADDQRVFEVMWDRRGAVMIAHQAVACTDLIGSAAVAALHVLRDPTRRRLEVDNLTDLLGSKFTMDQAHELADLALATGSAQTLRPVLDVLGVAGDGVSGDASSLHAWTVRTRSEDQRSVAWVHELSQTPLRGWPVVLRRALLLTEPEIRILYPDEPPGPRGLLRGRIRRLGRGVASLPAAVMLVARARLRRR